MRPVISRSKGTAAMFVGSCLLAAAPAAALEVTVKALHTPASIVRATIEVRDIVPDRFRKLMDAGTVLHLRVQTELWQNRPVWDRLVFPAITRVLRLTRGGARGEVTIADSLGPSAVYPAVPDVIPVTVDLGDRGRITVSEKYYLHVIATIGTLADREVDEAGDAVFGRESETNSLGSLGRLVFRAALKIGDYMQSVSAETKSRKLSGTELLKTSP